MLLVNEILVKWSVVQGMVEAIWALGLDGSIPMISPRRTRAVLSILLSLVLSSTASTPSIEQIYAWWQQEITSTLVNKAGLQGRLSFITIHVELPVHEFLPIASCSISWHYQEKRRHPPPLLVPLEFQQS